MDTYLKKGQKVCVIGSLKSSIFTKANGESSISLDVRINRIELLGNNTIQSEGTQKSSTVMQGSTTVSSEEDLPF